MAAGSHMQQTADRIHDKFHGGLVYPFEVLLVPTDRELPVLSDDFFTNSAKFIQEVAKEVDRRMPEAKGTHYNFISYQSGSGPTIFEDTSILCDIENTAAQFLPRQLPAVVNSSRRVRRLQDEELSDLRPLCSFFLDSLSNTEDYRKQAPTAAYGVIVASIEPLSKQGQTLLAELRRASEKFGSMYGIQAAISGTPAKALDMVTALYDTLPVAAIATLATAMIFLAIAFRSFVIPVRAIVSNLLTLGFTYGITVSVYQDGIIDFMNFSSVNGEYEALPWFAPVSIFFIITGIGLDYDIFLLVRVTELRAKGMDPVTAIQEGVCTTAGIITAAGMVMVFAFSGMLFSTMVQVNMCGFMLVVAVLYDTFIARSIVNPAVMSLLGYWNWFPSPLWRRTEESGAKVSTRTISAEVYTGCPGSEPAP
jgi:hypothetical protein